MTPAGGERAHWVMWIGPRQWAGLPGEFSLGQAGWAYPSGDAVGTFCFFPALGSASAWSYGVVCEAEDVLRFTAQEHA